jgi:hypothetical protein
MALSVLAKAEVDDWPFPHVVIEDCLPWDYYRELLATRPAYEAIVCGRDPGNNLRMDVPAKHLLSWPQLPSIWREFIQFHTSQAFWQEICDLFGIPDGERIAGVRFRDPSDIVMDCQIGLNTPVLERSRVRGPHVDNPVEIFAGLLYMGDEQKGGDLLIYEPVEPLLFYGKAEIYDRRVRPVEKVRYAHNTFVGFINLPHAVHGVTPRDVTDEPRWLVNFVAEQHKPRFELPREPNDRRNHSVLHRI